MKQKQLTDVFNVITNLTKTFEHVGDEDQFKKTMRLIRDYDDVRKAEGFIIANEMREKYGREPLTLEEYAPQIDMVPGKREKIEEIIREIDEGGNV